MLTGTHEELQHVLDGSAWGPDLDYVGPWTLDDQPGWQLHLRTRDTRERGTPGVVYAVRPSAGDGPGGAVLAFAVTPDRLRALLAVLDHTGDLRDLARLLRASGHGDPD